MATDNVANETEQKAIPFRWWEVSISAYSIGAEAAATLALRSPGMLGVVKFMAARGDEFHEVCEALGLDHDQLDRILQEDSPGSR